MKAQSMMTTAPPEASLRHPSYVACRLVRKLFKHAQLEAVPEQMVDLPPILQLPRQVLHYPQSHRVLEAEE